MKSREEQILDALHTVYEGEFMRPYIEYGSWDLVEGEWGDVWYVPEGEGTMVGEVKDVIEGWGAWLSAPGYLDRTDTMVFESFKDAIEHLWDLYGGEYEDLPPEKKEAFDVIERFLGGH
ncbi:MAG: hypothetical protein D6812_04830 [Deltaproteobacteria bacterium]|nr:MAG: hypothetical protein D6812_04830 [Deltaproteobacteria bacterium]